MVQTDTTTLLIRTALQEDAGDRGDITSRATLPAETRLIGTVRAKAQGVLAGLEIAADVFREVDDTLTIRLLASDGDHIKPGDEVMEVEGHGVSVLTGERVALNFLQRLSGIATLTSRFVEAVRGTGAVILDTRKTIPGYRALEKYAVRMGGGSNHRIGLYDMVLIKDNHIDGAGSITNAVRAVRGTPEAAGLSIEVEVRSMDELTEALSLGVDRIMLDNMDTETMHKAVKLAAGRIPLEASGTMNLEKIRSTAETGVDFISVGALTHSAQALDLSMKIVRLN